MTYAEQLNEGVAHLAGVDPIMKQLSTLYGSPSFTPHTNYYQELVDSIVSQQLSVKAAATIMKRFVALFPGDFPTPEQILEKDVEEYRAVGLSRQKASYIRDLAEKILDGTVQFDHFPTLTQQEITDELIQIKGVGVWTAHMFLIFCMGRLDVLPVGDLGIKNGIQKLYGLKEKPDEATMIKIAKKHHWHPYASIASWYIWKSLDNTPNN